MEISDGPLRSDVFDSGFPRMFFIILYFNPYQDVYVIIHLLLKRIQAHYYPVNLISRFNIVLRNFLYEKF